MKNIQNVIVIEERPNPSTDFFVLPQFVGDAFKVQRFGFNDLVDPLVLQGAIVVFVRYLPKAWRSLIAKNRVTLLALYFFMDDDLLDFKAHTGMPLRYRWKLARLVTFQQSWLTQHRAELWVSTPYLRDKYQAWSPVLMLPKPLDTQVESIKVFYHGSASHQAEIEWLHPIIKEVLQKNPHIVFEIVGGQAVYRQFKSLGRVQVVHPMSWQAYQAFIAQSDRAIGLVPLLPSPFNQARSFTKFFDITQAGAVGIYAKHSEVGLFATHDVDALVLDAQAVDWVNAILELAQDSAKRAVLLKGAKNKLANLK